MNGQMLESESKIKNEIIQQKAVREGIENEVKCPRCYDMMTLCSDFVESIFNEEQKAKREGTLKDSIYLRRRSFYTLRVKYE